MLSKKHVFYAVIVIQGLVLLFLVLLQAVPFDVTSYTYAWFYNSNQQIIITKENKTHVCIPINPTVPTGETFLLIIVTSRSLTEDKREAIRETWAKTLKDQENQSVHLLFVIGCTRSIHLDRDVDREARHYPDILRVGFNEDEKGFNKRMISHAYRFAAQFKPKFMIKTRDDVYIQIPKLLAWLKTRQNNGLYAGRVHSNVKVIRDLQRKEYVSEKEYSQEEFPDYCSGAVYILSGDLLTKITQLEKKVPRFNVEDAYIGLLVSKLGVEPLDISQGLAHISDRTPNEIQSWNNQMFKELIIIGYNLLPNMMQYIQDRHKRIVNPIDAAE